MKFSEKWLREIANPPVSRAELVDRLTMSGLEVESVAAVAGEFAGVCVAESRDLRPHPDAERLRVCAADVGEGRRFQVVTGAGNVRNGMRVPFARVGAALPGGQHIERSKLRGIESEGMLCSPAELAIAESAEGVMELPPDAPLGADLRDYLGLDDFIIELNITPNRGDCLSVLGLARELSAEFACDVNLPKAFPVPAVIDDRFPVEVL